MLAIIIEHWPDCMARVDDWWGTDLGFCMADAWLPIGLGDMGACLVVFGFTNNLFWLFKLAIDVFQQYNGVILIITLDSSDPLMLDIIFLNALACFMSIC